MNIQNFDFSTYLAEDPANVDQGIYVDHSKVMTTIRHNLYKETSPQDTSFGISIALTLGAESWQIWMPWSHPLHKNVLQEDHSEEGNLANADNQRVKAGAWVDPLVPQPLLDYDKTYYFGALPWTLKNPQLGIVPEHENLCVIPMVTLINPSEERAYTIYQQLDDEIVDLEIRIENGSKIHFRHLHQRLGDSRKIAHTYHLIEHSATWRAGLAQITKRHPEYFYPSINHANEISGLGAYSTFGPNIDLAKMRAMGFGVNWKASFDFPYMGQFLPPVEAGREWTGFHGDPVSITKMAEYAKKMRSEGFHVLNYFNVFEFGTAMNNNPRTDIDYNWQDPVRFFETNFPNAALKAMEGEPVCNGYEPLRGSGAYTSWEGCVVVDPDNNDYTTFLIEQIQRHLDHIADSSGICIDRLDWTRLFNSDSDDGISFANNTKVKSMLVSWKRIIGRIASLVHSANKVVWVNNHNKRIDTMLHVDGIFDEFSYKGAALNTTALLTLFKPAIGWVANERQVLNDPDNFFQRYLHMGVLPMAPFPGNDHALLPSPEVDTLYLKYGPLFKALIGCTWVLDEFECQIQGKSGSRLNLFKNKDHLVIVITHCYETTTLTLAHNPMLTEEYGIIVPSGVDAQLHKETTDNAYTLSNADGAAIITIALNP